jgi:hypothetical protein
LELPPLPLPEAGESQDGSVDPVVALFDPPVHEVKASVAIRAAQQARTRLDWNHLTFFSNEQLGLNRLLWLPWGPATTPARAKAMNEYEPKG